MDDRSRSALQCGSTTFLDGILAWTETNDIPLRGHCLFWGVRGRVQDWLKKLDAVAGGADDDGRCERRAFYGRHRVESGGKKAVVYLRRKDRTASVTLR